MKAFAQRREARDMSQSTLVPKAPRRVTHRGVRWGSLPAAESLATYLDQIGKEPLANPREQLDQGLRLAETRRRLQEGILRRPPLREEKLQLLAEAYEAARRDLVQSHLRLVMLLVRPYMNRGIAAADLVQEGNMGLLRAADLFDPRRGWRFSTYARWWIRQHVLGALAGHAGPVKVPPQILITLTRLRRASSRLAHELGRPARVEEMANECGIPLVEARRAFLWARPAISLEDSDWSDTSLAERLPGPTQTDEVWSDTYEKLEERVRRAIGSLKEGEQKVLDLRFGLSDGPARSRRETATILRLSAERIRQIELAALGRLRDPHRWGVPVESLL